MIFLWFWFPPQSPNSLKIVPSIILLVSETEQDTGVQPYPVPDYRPLNHKQCGGDKDSTQLDCIGEQAETVIHLDRVGRN